MPTSNIYRGSVVRGTANPRVAPFYVDSDDNRVKTIPAGSGTTEVVLQETVNQVLTPTAAFSLTAAQSGFEILLNAAAGFAITLPAVAVGLRYRFTVGAAFATTNFTIITPALADIIQGAADVNSTLVPAVDEDTISFVATAETIGDWVEVWADATKWYVNGRAMQAGAITFTQAG